MQEQMTAKFYVKTVGKFITFFLVAFVLYQVVNKVVLNFLGMEKNTYIGGLDYVGDFPRQNNV